MNIGNIKTFSLKEEEKQYIPVSVYSYAKGTYEIFKFKIGGIYELEKDIENKFRTSFLLYQPDQVSMDDISSKFYSKISGINKINFLVLNFSSDMKELNLMNSTRSSFYGLNILYNEDVYYFNVRESNISYIKALSYPNRELKLI